MRLPITTLAAATLASMALAAPFSAPQLVPSTMLNTASHPGSHPQDIKYICRHPEEFPDQHLTASRCYIVAKDALHKYDTEQTARKYAGRAEDLDKRDTAKMGDVTLSGVLCGLPIDPAAEKDAVTSVLEGNQPENDHARDPSEVDVMTSLSLPCVAPGKGPTPGVVSVMPENDVPNRDTPIVPSFEIKEDPTSREDPASTSDQHDDRKNEIMVKPLRQSGGLPHRRPRPYPVHLVNSPPAETNEEDTIDIKHLPSIANRRCHQPCSKDPSIGSLVCPCGLRSDDKIDDSDDPWDPTGPFHPSGNRLSVPDGFSLYLPKDPAAVVKAARTDTLEAR